jgi:hypothetical protein
LKCHSRGPRARAAHRWITPTRKQDYYKPVIPTGTERSEVERRDLFLCPGDKKRSLDYAALWAASLGITEKAHVRAPLCRTKELSCARRSADTLHISSLTELSNVVAYACRHSRTEDRRRCTRSAFFGCPSTGDQSFTLQGFAATRNGRRKPFGAASANGACRMTPSRGRVYPANSETPKPKPP